MPTLDTVLADPAIAGIYRLPGRPPVAALRERIERAGLRCFTLDGDGITDKASFLRACAEALAFPAYFGRNWDAFEECLTDPSLAPANGARGTVLLYDHTAPFIRHAPDDWAVALDILAGAVEYWRRTPTPLSVLLRRTGGLAPTLPRLDL
jgi:hypothetical protein